MKIKTLDNTFNVQAQDVASPLKEDYFLAADIETTPINSKGDQEFIVGGITNGKKFFYTDDLDSYIYMLGSFKQKIIYFHNLGYDFRFLMEELNKNKNIDYVLNFQFGKIIKICAKTKLKHKKRKSTLFELRDSYCVLPLKLKCVAKDMNDIYKKTDYEFNENKTVVVDKKLIDYLGNDCLALYESLSNLKILLDLKRINTTIGCISINTWINEHLPCNINDIYQPYYLYDFFKSSCYGGRVEVFERKGTDLYYYDYNSMYPAVMAFNKYPIGKCVKFKDTVPGNCTHYIAYVENIHIPEDVILPPIPAKRGNGSIYYPVGNIKSGTYNNVDLELLTRMGGSYKLVNGVGWNNSDYIFSDYIKNMYELKKRAKKDNNSSLYLISKLRCNTLFGKTGQSNVLTEAHKITNKKDFLKLERNKSVIKIESTEFPSVFCVHKISKHSIMSHLTSFILSHARKKLYESLFSVLVNGGKIYYCDTDSIVTNIPCDYDNVKLGELGLEYDDIKLGYFPAPKFYALKRHAKKEDIDRTTIIYEKEKVIEKRHAGDNENVHVLRGKGVDIEKLSFFDYEKLVEDGVYIENESTRVSKIKSILNGHKGVRQCYNLKRVISGETRQRLRKGKYGTVPIIEKQW